MSNLKFTLCYDGADFHGWERQPGLRTVQGEFERAIFEITGARVESVGSGRTDAGVHALGQVASAAIATRLECAELARAMNALLPSDVRVLKVERVADGFHATLDARSKRYRYVVDNGDVADPFRRRYAWHVRQPLDADLMDRAARALLGRHDFRSFETEWPNRRTSVRTISAIEVVRDGPMVRVEVEADGFLYHMVRAIVGSLVWVGYGKRSESFVSEALGALDRRAAGPNAPAAGLFLLWVRYDGCEPISSEPPKAFDPT